MPHITIKPSHTNVRDMHDVLSTINFHACMAKSRRHNMAQLMEQLDYIIALSRDAIYANSLCPNYRGNEHGADNETAA